MDLRELFRIIRRWLWLLILCGILGGGAAFAFSYFQQPTYESKAEVFISQPRSDQLSDLGYLNGQQLIQTYIELMVAEQVLDETSQQLGYSIDPEQITIQQIRDTQIIEVTVEDTSPYRAADFANVLVAVFSQQQYEVQTSRFAESKANLESNLTELRALIDDTLTKLSELPNDEENKIEREWLNLVLAQANNTYSNLLNNYESLRLEEAQSVSTVQLVEAAKANPDPVRPKVITNTFLGIVVGVMIAGGVLFLVEYLDDTVRSPEEITKAYDLSILAYIPKIPQSRHKREESGIYSLTQPRSPVAEAFRSLRTNIEFAGMVKPVKTVLVTSPGPNEGKGSVSSNLAAVIAQGGRKVALVDCDLHRPQVHKYFGINNRWGLTDIFRNQANLNQIMDRRSKTLFAITSGALPPNPAELLGSDIMDQVLEKLSKMVDVVILDSSPMVVTDPVLLSKKVDGVLLVINPGQTKREMFEVAMTQFERAGARLLGVVANQIGKNTSFYYYPHKYYQVD